MTVCCDRRRVVVPARSRGGRLQCWYSVRTDMYEYNIVATCNVRRGTVVRTFYLLARRRVQRTTPPYM